MAFRYTQKQRYIQPSYSKDTTYSSSGDYLDYISNLDNVPRYPSVNNDEAYRNDIGSDYDQDTDGTIHIEHHHNHVPESHARPQRVRFVDSVEPPVVDGNKRRGVKPPKEKGGAIMSVDDEADNFIKANHRGFVIRRWNTFTM
uniref:Uncharacterized protein n=1 Tax=Chenopodium quinoa TaxID=63459 RepID=A0A803L8F5_CHEQI